MMPDRDHIKGKTRDLFFKFHQAHSVLFRGQDDLAGGRNTVEPFFYFPQIINGKYMVIGEGDQVKGPGMFFQ